jgi:hypothetical protein
MTKARQTTKANSQFLFFHILQHKPDNSILAKPTQ